MTLDLIKLIEQARQLLAQRQKALQATLDEIALLEAAGAPAIAIAAARVKRDRQHNACTASEQLINALEQSKATAKRK